MLAWGTRYFAAAAGQLYLDRLDHITLVNDKSDLATIVARGTLVTPAYTFFNHPPDWWARTLARPIYLQAAALAAGADLHHATVIVASGRAAARPIGIRAL